MWNELESYKNHFLQKELKHMKPIAISPLVQNEFRKVQSKHKKCQFPCENPIFCNDSTYFDDRTQLAYGFSAIPKLIRELCSSDLKVQWRAINSLSEFLMNPVNAQRAITEHDLVRILKNAFLRHRTRYLKQRYREIERLLECFRILSIYHNGAKDISKRKMLCDEFYKIFSESDTFAELSAAVFRNLSEKPDILIHLHDNSDSYSHLRDVFQKDPCRPKYPYNLWMHLSHFLEIDPETGIELGFFELLHMRIVKEFPKFYCLTMKCFALILRCRSGQLRFDNIDGVALLYNILSNDIKLLETYEYVVMAFLHGLQSKNAMMRCRDFVNLPKIITKFALKKPHGNCRLQLYALQVLRQLGEMPCIKEYMRINCEKNLRTHICLNEHNDCERQKLVHWLNRDVFETSNNL